MNQALEKINSIEQALIKGDLAGLTPEQRLNYYKEVCDTVGLNPITKPFEYIELNKKLTLYATKACTEQLRKIHAVSVKISARETHGDVYVVTADARLPSGREDSSTGAVSIKGLNGDALANAYMKAETKAKRRVTLSICGLAFLDETEVETIPDAKKVSDAGAQDAQQSQPQIESKPIDVAEYIVPFGKKYKGTPLKNIHPEELESFMKWLAEEGEKKPLSGPAVEFMANAKAYLEQIKWIRPQVVETEFGDAFEG